MSAELAELLAQLQPAEPEPEPPPYDPEFDWKKGISHFEVGSFAAVASSKHLKLGQKGYEAVQASVCSAVDRVKAGDLSDIEAALTEQFFLFHSMAVHYADSAANCHPDSKKLAPAVIDMAVKCSKTSKQIATAIASIKHPKQVTFIKNQQNNLYARLEEIERRLGAATDAELDTRSERSPAASCVEVQAVAEEYRPKD